MTTTEQCVARGLLAALFFCAPAPGQIPPLLPVDDIDAIVPLSPAGVIRNAPELFGLYVYVWALDDGTQVLQYRGDFTLQLGDRRLQSEEAVIWMTRSGWQNTEYYHFEVFLSGQARVRDAAGTITSGPVLFVTLNSAKPAGLEYDQVTGESSADTSVYQEAERYRQAVRAGDVTPPGEMQVTDLAAPVLPPRPEARPLVSHVADEETYDEQQRVITAIGHVYVSQGLIDSGEFLEIRADAAVLFLTQPDASARDEPTADASEESLPGNETEAPSDAGIAGALSIEGGAGAPVAGAYLRGDVVLNRGERMIRAPELYYDFENDRALILDAVMRAMAPGRDLPIYVRAEAVRQLSSTEYLARKAMITTSEFYTPHLHIGAERVHLTDMTLRDATGDITGLRAGRYRARDVTLNLEGVPIAYWPYTAGDFRETETSIRRLRTAFSDDFGATFESEWYLFNLLGLEKPEGVDATLRLDYYSKRGPGVGLDVEYEVEDAYGEFLGYYIHDRGEDNLGPFRDGEPDTDNRGRITWRHRQFLPKGWELTLEGSYISDPNFLEEYFNDEFEEGKEQETLIYLKKQKDNWAFTALAQWRMLDFLTQTEHLPDLGFQWIGEPLGEIASFFSDSHLGFVRYRPDNRRLFDTGRILDNDEKSDITFRGDTREEITLPIKLGDVNIVPYAMGRAGYWDSSPDEGSVDRLFGSLGVRAGTQFWRLYEGVQSDLLDVNGVRHVIKPEVTAFASTTNRDSLDLYPFDDGIETIDDFYGTSLAVRQRWQTKRGGPGDWRVVDWIAFALELNLFGNTPRFELPIGRFYDSRPEDSIARNHVRGDFLYRISDSTTILADANFDLNDGTADLLNISYAVERSPRFSYFVGYRRIHDTDSDLIGFGTNYEINVKHRIALRAWYDVERSKTEEFDITLIRKFPRWYAALTFAVDQIEEDFSVGVSVWPEGAPQAALGSRRFTKLATSTALRPEEE